MNKQQQVREALKQRSRNRNQPTIIWQRGEREALIQQALEAGKLRKCEKFMPSEGCTFGLQTFGHLGNFGWKRGSRE